MAYVMPRIPLKIKILINFFKKIKIENNKKFKIKEGKSWRGFGHPRPLGSNGVASHPLGPKKKKKKKIEIFLALPMATANLLLLLLLFF
jgi:hypothetical protein